MNKIKRPSNLSQQLERVWDCLEDYLAEHEEMNMKKVAGRIKMTPESLSRALHGGRGLTDKLILSMAELFKVNPGYLLMKSQQKHLTPEHEKQSDREEMQMALDVLGSDTHYADSLRKNIRSFHRAIDDKRRLHSEIDELHRENNELREKIAVLEAKVKKLEASFFSSSGHMPGENMTVIPTHSPKK